MPLRFAAETGRLFLDAILFYPLLSRSLPPASPAVSPHQTYVIFILILCISLSCLNSEFNPQSTNCVNCNKNVKNSQVPEHLLRFFLADGFGNTENLRFDRAVPECDLYHVSHLDLCRGFCRSSVDLYSSGVRGRTFCKIAGKRGRWNARHVRQLKLSYVPCKAF